MTINGDNPSKTINVHARAKGAGHVLTQRWSSTQINKLCRLKNIAIEKAANAPSPTTSQACIAALIRKAQQSPKPGRCRRARGKKMKVLSQPLTMQFQRRPQKSRKLEAAMGVQIGR